MFPVWPRPSNIHSHVMLDTEVCSALRLAVQLGDTALGHSTGGDIPDVTGSELSVQVCGQGRGRMQAEPQKWEQLVRSDAGSLSAAPSCLQPPRLPFIASLLIPSGAGPVAGCRGSRDCSKAWGQGGDCGE